MDVTGINRYRGWMHSLRSVQEKHSPDLVLEVFVLTEVRALRDFFAVMGSNCVLQSVSVTGF